ncbi:MAG: glycosyltransferase family 39 protein, partial [Deltaproteobacteria bacterium]|nr:glycosyltransferase family 39 protein [Deltaproteobacteria bacterium]
MQIAAEKPSEDRHTRPNRSLDKSSHRVRLASNNTPLALAALALIIGLYLWRISLLKIAAFNPDEFWHLHSAWCVSKGMIPYRDFFEHHTPWLYFLLAPIFHFYRVDDDPNAAVAFIFVARRIMALFAAIVLVLTFALGRLWRGQRVAWLSTALLSTSVVYAWKTLEIRPDGPALMLWLGCLATILRAVDSPELTELERRSLFILSGLLLGGAVMTAQKMLIVMPGFGLTMLWYLVAGDGPSRKRLLNCLCQSAGFAVPIIATSLFFWAHGALWTFFKHVFMNLGWKTHFPSYMFIRWVIAQNPVLILLGFFGLIRSAFDGTNFSRDRLVFVNTAGAIGGVFTLPTPWLQNYLIFLPLLALYAGDFVLLATDRICAFAAASHRVGGRVSGAFVFALLASLALVLLSAPAPVMIHLLFATTVLSGSLLLFRFRAAGLAVLLMAFSIHPVYQMRSDLSSDNRAQLERLHYVLANTLPTDTVMDGWSGLGVFRKSAWFYPFIHGEIAAMLSATDRNQLLLGLQSGKIAPKFIFP